ncbi:LolA family protein [Alteraurantiacibacter aquimixticola]|uniref:Outer membrane lipoprotein carrier protein LolA n=1 Tax=Alteraurantiacibacter aquimixticola TaxID=2489173 RepID=A0A4T3F0Q4_9SPHN|nr:outer membrane lipoprotein carrier protein LolA [Alteraurantiacibacter aquimixticola]TIX48932.1 outer membrane lipoprotein carrier protein LolA [Alteraurantiacibacter aquimixticola]
MNALYRITKKPLGAAFAGALAVAVPVALALPAAPVAAQTSNQLNRAASALRAITTMRASFTQSDRSGQTVGGTLTMRNPGRIRFEYGDDVNMLIVSNGRTLSIADYDVQQLERYPISDSPLGALLDPERDITRYGRVVATNSPNVVSIAVADPNKPEFPELTLVFTEKSSAPGGLELTAWVARDTQNQRTTVRLSNHRYGIDVPDSTFRYRDPRSSSRRPG